jgi:hypothetical protein
MDDSKQKQIKKVKKGEGMGGGKSTHLSTSAADKQQKKIP